VLENRLHTYRHVRPPDTPGLRVLRRVPEVAAPEPLDPALPHSDCPHRRLRWNGLRLARTVPGP
jgi:hypothetical protein